MGNGEGWAKERAPSTTHPGPRRHQLLRGASRRPRSCASLVWSCQLLLLEACCCRYEKQLSAHAGGASNWTMRWSEGSRGGWAVRRRRTCNPQRSLCTETSRWCSLHGLCKALLRETAQCVTVCVTNVTSVLTPRRTRERRRFSPRGRAPSPNPQSLEVYLMWFVRKPPHPI